MRSKNAKIHGWRTFHKTPGSRFKTFSHSSPLRMRGRRGKKQKAGKYDFLFQNRPIQTARIEFCKQLAIQYNVYGPGTLALTIAGSINQSSGSVSGVVHVDGSNCFDRLATMGLTGTLTGDNLSLATTSVAGQVVTFTSSITNSAFTGTYTINGGCANGDQEWAGSLTDTSL
jgi:hypothetical protein